MDVFFDKGNMNEANDIWYSDNIHHYFCKYIYLSDLNVSVEVDIEKLRDEYDQCVTIRLMICI